MQLFSNTKLSSTRSRKVAFETLESRRLLAVTSIDGSTVTETFQDGLEGYFGTRDTNIHSSSASTNYGDNSTLEVDGKPQSAALVAWDIANIPQGSVVTEATIELNVTNRTRDEYEIYALRQAWDEYSATWNRASDDETWSQHGAAGNGDRADQSLGSLDASSTGAFQIELNAAGIALVQSWIDNPTSNHGVIFQNYEDASNGIDFSSRETSSVQDRPALIVSYESIEVGPTNVPPEVDAGPNRSVEFGNTVSLTGVVNDDGLPGSTVTTTWSQASGPGIASIADSSEIETTVTFDQAGIYVLRLSANDGELSSSDTVTVTVNEPVANAAPVVQAGSNQTVVLGEIASLMGIVSDDGLPGPTPTIDWNQVSGPGTATFADSSQASTTVEFSQPGTYALRLSASDGELSSSDTVTVTVSEPAANAAPVVQAGADETIELGSDIQLSGVVSDDGLPGSGLTMTWSLVAGPVSATFDDSSLASTSVEFSQAGTYVLRLAANDGEYTAFDEVAISVLQRTEPITMEFQDGLDGYAGTRDTMIHSSNASTNFGHDTTLEIDGKPDAAALVAWDLSSIAEGSTVTSAVIELDITNTTRDTYELYAVRQAWDELSATWQRASHTTAWGSSGANGSQDRGNSVLGTVRAASEGNYRIVLNGSGIELVQQWVDDPTSNHGVVLQDFLNASNGLDFTSSESNNASLRPKLSVTYQPVVEPTIDPTVFFATAEDSSVGLDPSGIYPFGQQIGFGLYSVVGTNQADPTRTNFERVAEEGFTLVGPYYSPNWQSDFEYIYASADQGLQFTYQIRQHPSLDGVSVTDRPTAIAQLTDGEIADHVREQVEAILNDPIARDTVARWSLLPEELRYWQPQEMRYLEVATATVRQVEAARGEQRRPLWMYEPNHRNATALQLTGQYQDIVSKGVYQTTRSDRGEQRSGWALWSYDQISTAAEALGSTSQAVLQLTEDFTDPATGTSVEEITRVLRHDVYLALVQGIDSLNIFSMYENRPNLTTHNEQFEAYGSVAHELTGPLNLQEIFLFGEERSDLVIEVVEGDEYVDFQQEYYGTLHQYYSLNHLNVALRNDRFLVLVNSSESPMSVEISNLPERYYVDDLLAETSTSASGSKLTQQLDALGVKVLRIRAVD